MLTFDGKLIIVGGAATTAFANSINAKCNKTAVSFMMIGLR